MQCFCQLVERQHLK